MIWLGSELMFFSGLFATHDGHEKPSARRIVRVVALVIVFIVLMVLVPSDRDIRLEGGIFDVMQATTGEP
jgi:hypothetical protein